MDLEQFTELRSNHNKLISQITHIEKQIIEGSNNADILALLGALGTLHADATKISEELRVMAAEIRKDLDQRNTNRK